MVPRYTRPEMAAIWAPENRYRIWFEIEALAAEGMAQVGAIPAEAARTIREHRAPMLAALGPADGGAPRRERGGDAPRRYRLSHLPRRRRRRGQPLRPSRHDEFGRARHLPRRATHPGDGPADRGCGRRARGPEEPSLRP